MGPLTVGTIAATSLLRDERTPAASRFGVYPVTRIASLMRSRVPSATCSGWFSTRETVLGATPARRATSTTVAAPPLRRARFFGPDAFAMGAVSDPLLTL